MDETLLENIVTIKTSRLVTPKCFLLSVHCSMPSLVCSSYSVIVWVRVALKRTVVGHWRFDNLSGSHLQISSCVTTMTTFRLGDDINKLTLPQPRTDYLNKSFFVERSRVVEQLAIRFATSNISKSVYY